MDPPALRERPLLSAKLLYFRAIFLQLSDSRTFTQHGHPLPIPISEYAAYCDFFGIRQLGEKERLFKLVRAMDRAYLQHTMKKREANDTNSTRVVAPD